jgi:hypothetical protein
MVFVSKKIELDHDVIDFSDLVQEQTKIWGGDTKVQKLSHSRSHRDARAFSDRRGNTISARQAKASTQILPTCSTAHAWENRWAFRHDNQPHGKCALKLVKFQQRYQMRNGILSKAIPPLELRPFCNSQNCALLVRQFWGFDSDRILQLFV